MRRLLRICAVFAFGFPMPALAAPEAAAVLTQIHGKVLVDAGKGFSAVSEGVRLKLGDRVLVSKEGGAILSYGAKCSLPLQAPSMTVVEATACTIGTQGTSDEERRRFCRTRRSDNEDENRRRVSPCLLLIPAATFAVIGLFGDNDDDIEPASP